MQRVFIGLVVMLAVAGCRKDWARQDLDGDGTTELDGDCGPGDPLTGPDAAEVCNGRDDNCDGTVDEGVGSTWFADADGDGFGDAASSTLGCLPTAGNVAQDGDCDDADARVNPAARELCTDDIDWNCDDQPGRVDGDGDGVAACEDCDDEADKVFPGAEELCNGVDDDCDGEVDDAPTDATAFFVDLDGDGFGSDRLMSTACDAPDGFVDAADDCDDLSAATFPNAPELCDGLDNDCNDTIDDGATGTLPYWADADKDGFGDPNVEANACARPAGYTDNFDDCNDADATFNPGATESCTDLTDYNCDGSVGQADGDGDGTPACTDCDDSNKDVEPGAPEICDGFDNDCNGQIDETAPTWHADVDGDGHGGKALFVVSCQAPGGFVASTDDCDDLDARAYPGATEACNGRDDDCTGGVPANESDADADHWSACQGDCNDTNKTAFPGGAELCDGVDNDCDGTPDDAPLDAVSAWADGDLDGVGAGPVLHVCAVGAGQSAVQGDCNDSVAAVKPGATESCNTVDDDCDGLVDEAGSTGATTYYLDADGDGVGGAKVSVAACASPAGYVALNTDCDDTDARSYPLATELCDGLDNNCDKASLTGEADSDKDNWRACGGDCNDASKAVSPSAVETCNSVDDDCDGTTDVNAVGAVTWFADGDADGWGNTATTKIACAAPSGYVAIGADCNDGSKAISPSADELCSTKTEDDDCDGSADEQDARDATVWFQDADGDGHGTASNFALACTQPSGRVAIADDCNDANKFAYTGAPEVWYDGVDQNCDAKSDFDQDGDGQGAYSKSAGEDCNDTDATEVFCGTSAGTALASCSTLLAARPGLASGVYWVDADGVGVLPSFQVYCENDTAGGGWTLLIKASGTDFPFESPYWTDGNLLNATSTTPDWTSAKYRSFLDVPVQELLLKSQAGNYTHLRAPTRLTMQQHFNAPTTVLTYQAGAATAHLLVNGLNQPLCGPAWRINTYVSTSRAIRLGSWQTYNWACGYGNDASGNDTSAEFFGFGIRDATWSPWVSGGKSFGIRQAHDVNNLPGGGQIATGGQIYGR